MEVEIKIDESRSEPKVVIVTNRMTDEINEILKKLTADHPSAITGFKDDFVEILEPADICRIYASNGKVIAQTSRGEYFMRLRLYELEQRLDSHCFVRISNAEIINLKKVRGFDLSIAGTICVILSDGTVTYVSRRFVSKIKTVLGM